MGDTCGGGGGGPKYSQLPAESIYSIQFTHPADIAAFVSGLEKCVSELREYIREDGRINKTFKGLLIKNIRTEYNPASNPDNPQLEVLIPQCTGGLPNPKKRITHLKRYYAKFKEITTPPTVGRLTFDGFYGTFKIIRWDNLVIEPDNLLRLLENHHAEKIKADGVDGCFSEL